MNYTPFFTEKDRNYNGFKTAYIFCLIQMNRRWPCSSCHVFKVVQVSWQLGGERYGKLSLRTDILGSRSPGHGPTFQTYTFRPIQAVLINYHVFYQKKKFCSELVWLLTNYGKGWGSHLSSFGHMQAIHHICTISTFRQVHTVPTNFLSELCWSLPKY